MSIEIIYVWSDGTWCDVDDALEYIEVHGDNYTIADKSSEYAQTIIGENP